MEKRIYLTPLTQVIHVSQEAVMASESWYDGHGNWNHVIEGNPENEVDPYSLYSKPSDKSVWAKWD